MSGVSNSNQNFNSSYMAGDSNYMTLRAARAIYSGRVHEKVGAIFMLVIGVVIDPVVFILGNAAAGVLNTVVARGVTTNMARGIFSDKGVQQSLGESLANMLGNRTVAASFGRLLKDTVSDSSIHSNIGNGIVKVLDQTVWKLAKNRLFFLGLVIATPFAIQYFIGKEVETGL